MLNEISENIRYIGTDDPEIQWFENQYPLSHGMSYNSYAIIDEKIAILDTSDSATLQQWSIALHNALANRQPDYLVVHHVEPDHTQGIMTLLNQYPSMKLVASKAALAMLTQFFDAAKMEGRCIAVREGDVLDLGEHKLKFIAAPMVHWPEVLMSYEEKEGVLFSADGFGKFGAISYHDDWANEARRYYANIVGRFGAQVQSVLKKASNLDVKTIAPLHGPVLQGESMRIAWELYNSWSAYAPETSGVLVAYASIYGATANCALTLAQMLLQRGVEVTAIDISHANISEAVAQAFRMSTLVLAAPTYDGTLFPSMQQLIEHLQQKNLKNRKYAIIENGSWAPTAGRIMAAMMNQMKDMEKIEPTVSIRSKMRPSDSASMIVLADTIAEACVPQI